MAMARTREIANRSSPFGTAARFATFLVAGHAGLARTFVAERARWLLWLPVLFGGGIALYFSWPREPAPWIGTAAFAATAILVWRARRRPALSLILISASAIAAGFAAGQLRTQLVAAPRLAKPVTAQVSGQVDRVDTRRDGARLTIAVEQFDRLPQALWPARVRIVVRGSEVRRIRVGDRVRVRARLLPPARPAAPGAFDFARYAYFDRIGAVGFAFGAVQRVDAHPDSAIAPHVWIANLRRDVAKRIAALAPSRGGAMAQALMTGDRGAIAEETWRVMRQSGLAHLLAISGLHVGLVAAGAFFAVRFLFAAVPAFALRYPIKKWAAGVALMAAFGYLIFTGATVPTQRAFLMIAIVLLAIFVDRNALSMRLVALAAAVILILRPESILSASFQLSFAAVVALVAGYEVLQGAINRLRAGGGHLAKAFWYLAGVALTTVIATLATSPLAYFHFNQFAAYGLAANMVAVPLMALWIMPMALLGFVLFPFGAEGLALAPMIWGIDGVLATADFVANLDGAVWRGPAPSVLMPIAFVVGGLWLCLWQRLWRLLGLAPIALALALALAAVAPDVLVDERGRTVLVREPSGAANFSTRYGGRIVRETWLRRLGLGPGAGHTLSQTRFRCDSIGCAYHRDRFVVAHARTADALAEDCQLADIVIASVPIRRPCSGPQVVIGRFDLWRLGAHAIWLGSDGAVVRSVENERGARRWSFRPARFKRDQRWRSSKSASSR